MRVCVYMIRVECRAKENSIDSRANRAVGWRYRAPIASYYLFMITSFAHFSLSILTATHPNSTAYVEHIDCHSHLYTCKRCVRNKTVWMAHITCSSSIYHTMKWKRRRSNRNYIFGMTCCINWYQFECVCNMQSLATVNLGARHCS